MRVAMVAVADVGVAVLAGMVVRGVIVSGVRVLAAIAVEMIVGSVGHVAYFTHSLRRALGGRVSGKFDTFAPRLH